MDYYLKSSWELCCMYAITWSSLGDFKDGSGNWRISAQGKHCKNKWHISCYVHVHNMKSPVYNIATGHIYLATYPPGGVIIAYCINTIQVRLFSNLIGWSMVHGLDSMGVLPQYFCAYFAQFCDPSFTILPHLPMSWSFGLFLHVSN